MNSNALKTVLYVDDEPDIREVVELSLGLAGDLSVHTCASGEDALDLLQQIVPDLIWSATGRTTSCAGPSCRTTPA